MEGNFKTQITFLQLDYIGNREGVGRRRAREGREDAKRMESQGQEASRCQQNLPPALEPEKHREM